MAPYSVINAIMLSDKKAQSIDKCNKVDGSLRFQQLVAILVLLQEEMRACPPTLPF